MYIYYRKNSSFAENRCLCDGSKKKKSLSNIVDVSRTCYFSNITTSFFTSETSNRFRRTLSVAASRTIAIFNSIENANVLAKSRYRSFSFRCDSGYG